MGERADGRWSARLVGVSAPRQQGKSQLIVARALAGVLLFNEQTIICSAHQTDTAREVFQRLLDIIDDNPAVSRRVDSVMKAIGREHIRFQNGQIIRIKARSIAGSRGFSADCLLLDEAQILGRAAWSSILPTMSARENPQAWLLGTPPTPQDDGEVFAQLRDQGMTGAGSRMAYVEWSADAEDDLDDPATWAKANPAYGSRISHEAIEAERASMTDEQFAMERLGMWQLGAGGKAIIDSESWATVADAASMAVERLALGIEVAPDRSVASVALAGERVDGLWHVELDEQRSGTGWIVPWVKARCERNAIRAVVIDELSPAASLLEDFAKAKVKVTTTSGRELANACGQFFDGVMDARLRHTDQPQVNVALSVVGKRPLGDRWVWNRKTANADITPIVAESLALWGAQAAAVKRPGGRRTGGRKAVVL